MNFKYKAGALTCDKAINNITQDISKEKDTMDFYGNPYFICETITINAARKIADLIYKDQATLTFEQNFTFLVE